MMINDLRNRNSMEIKKVTQLNFCYYSEPDRSLLAEKQVVNVTILIGAKYSCNSLFYFL